jgi:hypothetical protein
MRHFIAQDGCRIGVYFRVLLAYETEHFFILRPSCKTLDRAAKDACCLQLGPAIHETQKRAGGAK